MFIYLLAIWAFLTGIIELVIAHALRAEIRGEILLAFTGVLSIALVVVLFTRLEMGIVGVGLLSGLYAILFGFLLIILAFRLRGLMKSLETGV